MKFTLSWLKDHLETNKSLQEITDKLTAIGLEVEEVIDKTEQLKPFNIAQIISAKPHPDADKLQICQVKTSSEELQIVCGASNARAGINVVLASVGCVIPTNNMKIKASKIRGVASNGMLCSASELGVGSDDAGIIEMPRDDSEIGKNYAEINGLNDPLIEIAITPNRGDCLGVYGIARDLAAAGLGKLKPLEFKKLNGDFDNPIATKISDDSCIQFMSRYFKNVQNCESPNWLKKRLESIGAKPISALVDITNYISFAFGRPLHVYDADKLSGNLNIRKANKDEKITALDDNEYQLDDSICVVCDDKQPVAIAGIIGEKNSGCDENTKNVLLEIAEFDAISVASAGRKLGIITDSRYRFERNIDPNFLDTANHIATKLILEICGGKPSKTAYVGKKTNTTKSINFDFDYVKKRSGVDVSQQEITKILNSLGFEVEGNEIIVPSWRKDVEGKADIVEEIIRIYGYDKIPEIATNSPAIAKSQALSHEQNRIETMRKTLVSNGLTEAVTWSFMDSRKSGFFKENNDSLGDKAALTILNPISSELDIMRPSILPNLIDAVGKNLARGNNNINLFEYGLIFESAQPKGQRPCIAGVRSGDDNIKNIHSNARKVDVFDAKSDCFNALEAANIPTDNLKTDINTPNYYHPGRSGALKLGKEIIAYFGEIHPKINKAFDVKTGIVGFEIFIDKLPKIKKKKTNKAKLEKLEYQASFRDFAFLIDKQVNADDILRAIKSSDKKLIKNVRIFDIYEGDKIEDNKKSIALSVKIQSATNTLTENDLEQISGKIIAAVGKIGGQLRG